MSAFRQALSAVAVPTGPRRWHYLPYDQLSPRFLTVSPERAGVVLVESAAKARRRPYHRQKLALILANQRHFALELARLGVAVDVLAGEAPIADALAQAVSRHGPLHVAEPAERELRAELAPLTEDGRLVVGPHPGWLTTAADWDAAFPNGRGWKMDAFYRRVRARTGLLMVDGQPEGGRWSTDADNREPWPGRPAAPIPPRFVPDAVTQEVGALILARFADHPGRLDLEALPATVEDAARVWQWALAECLPQFGPFEDAMSLRSRGLFHARIAPLLHLHRLWPAEVVAAAAAAPAPLSSREGFVRQILGWREYVRHVHVRTDGFRDQGPVRPQPGDGGWSAVSGRPWPGGATRGVDGGAAPSLLGGEDPVPPVLWGTPSGLNCLDEVVRSVWDEGWSHHITRLMVIGNWMTLLGVSPRALTDWFWVAYIDAYDWVVEPNVLGMASFATDRLTTKPYVSGSPYLARMSDYCTGCQLDPKKSCPMTSMYWAFLEEHQDRFRRNPRMAGPVASLARRAPARRDADRRVRDRVRARLMAGERVDDSDVPGAR